LIGLQTDIRAAFLGAKLNPMLAVSLDVVVADETALLEVLRTPAAPKVPIVSACPAHADAPAITHRDDR
jgi:hypothetical protein